MENTEKEIQLVGRLFKDLVDKVNKIESKKNLFKDIKELSYIEIKAVLAVGGEGMKSMTEISETLGVTGGTSTVTINKLIEREYAERIRDVGDRRQVFIKLSDKGMEALESVMKLRAFYTEKMFEVLTPEERKSLISSVTKLNDKIDEVLSQI